jgi:hypothetical protein
MMRTSAAWMMALRVRSDPLNPCVLLRISSRTAVGPTRTEAAVPETGVEDMKESSKSKAASAQIPHCAPCWLRNPVEQAIFPGTKEEKMDGASAVQWALPSAKTSATELQGYVAHTCSASSVLVQSCQAGSRL